MSPSRKAILNHATKDLRRDLDKIVGRGVLRDGAMWHWLEKLERRKVPVEVK